MTAALVTSCAAPDEPEPAAVVEAQPERFGLVTLSYDEDEEAVGHDTLVTQAYFVEHEGLDRVSALRLLSAPIDGLVDAALPVDGCIVEERDLAAPLAAEGSVRLLDAGELMVETPDRALVLEGHYFPEVYSAVSGLQYDGVLVDSAAYRDGRHVTVLADGSDEVGEFAVSLAPPPVAHLLAVGGEPARRARRWAPDDGGLAVHWQAPVSAEPDEVAVLSYVRQGFGRVARVACAVVDDGAFVFPEAALAALPDLGDDPTERVVLSRVRAVGFAAAGVSEGLAVAIARDAVVLD